MNRVEAREALQWAIDNGHIYRIGKKNISPEPEFDVSESVIKEKP